MNISSTKSIGPYYEELVKIIKDNLLPTSVSSGDTKIDLQGLFKNLKYPVDDNDATTKQFVLNSIRDDAVHVKRKGDIMMGNIDMGGNYNIVNLNDTDLNPPDTHAATIGYVKRKVDSYIPRANLNLISSQGFKGKKEISSRIDDVYRFFPAGIVFPSDIHITKISLTTTNDPVANSRHVLRMVTSDIETSEPPKAEIVLEKLGTKLVGIVDVNKSISNKKISFQLDSYVGSATETSVIFLGESTLTLEILV